MWFFYLFFIFFAFSRFLANVHQRKIHKNFFCSHWVISTWTTLTITRVGKTIHHENRGTAFFLGGRGIIIFLALLFFLTFSHGFFCESRSHYFQKACELISSKERHNRGLSRLSHNSDILPLEHESPKACTRTGALIPVHIHDAFYRLCFRQAAVRPGAQEPAGPESTCPKRWS